VRALPGRVTPLQLVEDLVGLVLLSALVQNGMLVERDRRQHLAGSEPLALEETADVGPRYRRVGEVERHDAEAEPGVERLIRQIESPSGSRWSRRQAVDLDLQDQPLGASDHTRTICDTLHDAAN
jgi:hypothetical protein